MTLADEICDDLVWKIINAEALKMENALRQLLREGCDCGNRNLENFVLIYEDNKFKYVLCKCCKKRHYVEGVVYGIC